MEEFKQLRASHRAHRSHLTKTLTSVAEVLQKDSSEPLSELEVINLTTTIEGLQRRKGILSNLDGKIAMLITDEEELEEDIYECEEHQSNIVEKIAQLQYFVRHSTRSSNTPPVTTASGPSVTTANAPSQTEASETPVTASNILPAHSSSDSPATTQHSSFPTPREDVELLHTEDT